MRSEAILLNGVFISDQSDSDFQTEFKSSLTKLRERVNKLESLALNYVQAGPPKKLKEGLQRCEYAVTQLSSNDPSNDKSLPYKLKGL